MEDILQQGINAFKAGDRETARRLLISAIRQTPDNERAWGWLYNAANTDKERIDCLKQIVRINPGNERARQALNTLLQQAQTDNLPANIKNTQVSLGVQSKSPKKALPVWLLILLGVILLIVLGFGTFLATRTISEVSCRSQTQEYLDKLQPYLVEFSDSAKLADSTPRMSLGAIIQEMQRTKREINNLETPQCAKSAHVLMVAGIDGIIDGYLSFASSSDDQIVSLKIRQGLADFLNGTEQLKAIAEGKSTPTPVLVPTIIPTNTSVPFPTPLPPNSTVTLRATNGEKWQIKVLRSEIKYSIESSYGTVEKAAGKFAILHLQVTNRGRSTASFTGIGLMMLADSQGTISEVNPYFLALSDIYEPGACLDINPDKSATCSVIFDVAARETTFILAPGVLADLYSPSMIIVIP